MKMLLEICRLLDKHEQQRLLWLVVMSLFMALSTLVSIAGVLPFFTVLAEPQAIHRSALSYQQVLQQSERLRRIVDLAAAERVTWDS